MWQRLAAKANPARALSVALKCFVSVILAACLIAFSPCSSWSKGDDPNDRIRYVEDGEFSKELHVPSYEWYPRGESPTALIFAVHGLTLNGKRYEVLGRALASTGVYTCALDMRGFGRCYTDDKHSFCIGNDCKKKIDYEKSFADIVDMVTRVRKKFPAVPLFAVGESLGTCLCIKLAAEHPELVDGLILSGPAVKVNPLMFVHPKVIAAGTVGYFMHPRFQVNTDAFVKYLVSNDDSVVGELLADPLCRKGLSFHELIMTKSFVGKTLGNAKKIKRDTPILVIQGSEDRCMVPVAVTQLARSIPSSDQTLRWLHLHGHLLLETAYLKASTMEAVTEWMDQHKPGHKQIVKETMEELVQLGAKHSDDDL